MHEVPAEDPRAIAVVSAIQSGDTRALALHLATDPAWVQTRIVQSGQRDCSGKTARSLLHILTDWPGNFPNGAEAVGLLVAAGADVNVRFVGPHGETPLHWAASCDDILVLDALLDAGADIEAPGAVIEAPGAVIGGGTPLADAVAFGQWNAARRLVDRGAKTTLWQAAALGLLDRVEAYFEGSPAPKPEEVTNAFWCACHGGQRAAAEYLLAKGADRNWIGYDGLTPLGAASRSGADDLAAWLETLGMAGIRKDDCD